MAIDKVVSASIADDAVTNAKVSYNNNQFRNIIINGDMSVAQRGTSATVSDGSNEGYSTVDRFYTNFNANIGGAIDISQDTTVPDNQGFAKSLKIQCSTTASSFSGNTNLQVYQEIEAQNLQYLSYGSSSPKNIVYSFWCKSTNYTSPLSAIFRTIDGTAEYFVKSFTPTSTWQKFTFSVPGSTTATINNDNGSGLRVGICLAGSTDNEAPDSTTWSTTRKDLTDTQGNFLSSTSNILYMTGVQLEVGTAASDFEFLPVDVNLNRCQRYYFQYLSGTSKTVGIASYWTTTGVDTIINFPVEMRSAPSVVATSGSSYYTVYVAGNGRAIDAGLAVNRTNLTSTQLYATTASDTAGRAGLWTTTNSSASIAFSSEL
jgi:hypothetical protein